MRRLIAFVTAATVCGLIGTPNASAQQSVNFYLGGFVPAPLDARDANDVLVQNGTFLSTFNQDNGIDIAALNGVSLGGEYLVGIGRHVEGGLGLGFYQRSVLTSYAAQVNTDGSEITQTLKLRIVPFTATFKVLPFGTHAPVQPYIGAGVGVLAWRYSETGQFVDSKNNVFSGNFVGSGTATGPLILGGVRVPTAFGTIGGEIRYQAALGNLPASQDFAGTKIDLGGFHYLFTISVKF